MFSIILLILKIIGIILLLLIGLLVAILLIVLLVPIRYCVRAEHGEENLYINAKVNWLLHLLGANISHMDGILHIRVRVLWFTLFDNLKPRIKKGDHKSSRKQSKRKKVRNSKHRKNSKRKQSEDTLDGNVWEPIDNSAFYQSFKNKEDKEHNSENLTVPEIHIEEPTEIVDQSENVIPDYEETEKSRFDKIKNQLNKIKIKFIRIKDKMIAFFKGIKAKIIKWYETVRTIRHKISLISDFIKDEFNKEGFRVTLLSIKKLLKHILPTRLKAKIIFGTGDPCSTGQALGAIGVVYSFLGDKVQIIPDFENKRLEGNLNARGRIRLVTVLLIVIKLILDKRFKLLKYNFQILKEAL
jgi:Protein of unknown function (DUF2953).